MSDRVMLKIEDRILVYLEDRTRIDKSLVKLAESTDFMQAASCYVEEDAIMCNSLLVFEKFFAYGTKTSSGEAVYTIRPYHQGQFYNLIDYNLSLLGQPLRIWNLMREEDFNERLKKRTNPEKYWIEYDSRSGLLSERLNVKCPISELLTNQAEIKELYVAEKKERFIEVREHVVEGPRISEGDGGLNYDYMIRPGNVQKYQHDLDDLVQNLTLQGLMITGLPLIYCEHANGKGSSCLQRIIIQGLVDRLDSVDGEDISFIHA